MTRVAFDTSSMRGRKTGIGVYTAQLLDAIKNYAPQTETIALSDDATVEQRTDKRMRREQFTLPRLARDARADLLHLTGFAAPLRSPVPVILTVMDLIGVLFSQNFPPASRFYWSRYLPFTLRAAKHIITLSENTKRDVLRLTRVPAERITVIPPGVDARFRQSDDASALENIRARLNLPEKYFLFVSTIEPRKGVDTLVRAYVAIAGDVAENLVLVGKRGWGDKMLTPLENTERRVHFLDYVSDEDLPSVYQLATAFIFPSRYEGFGLTPLEAMACGTPVISSNASSLPEVVGQAGILLAPEDVKGFAEAMKGIASNETMRNELKAAGLERAQLYSWQRAATQTAECYKRVMMQMRGSSLQ